MAAIMLVIMLSNACVPDEKLEAELLCELLCEHLSLTLALVFLVSPPRSPTPEQILGSAASQKWFKVLPVPPPTRRYSEAGNGLLPKPGSSNSLIDTIIVPRDIRQLPRVLPPPSYDSDHRILPPAVPVHAAVPSAPARPPSSASNGSRPPSASNGSRGVSRPGSADKPGIGGVYGAGVILPPLLHREVSAGVLMPPVIRPGIRRQSYS